MESSTLSCEHLNGIEPVPPQTAGCEECIKKGARWLHLRLCLTCGHVGCCDSSPGRHATKHFHHEGHPLIASFEPGERWAWCYVDELELPAPSQSFPTCGTDAGGCENCNVSRFGGKIGLVRPVGKDLHPLNR